MTNTIIVYLNKQIYIDGPTEFASRFRVCKTMCAPRDTRLLCTRGDYKLTRFTRNDILQDLHDSLDHTIAEWKLRNGILIF